MKGKHSRLAETRREFQGYEQDLDAYRRSVARLTAENKRLEILLAERERMHCQEERKLTAMVSHAVSPQVDALNAIIADLKARNKEIKSSAARDADLLARVSGRFGGHLVDAHGMTYEAALRVLGDAIGSRVAGTLEYQAVTNGEDPGMAKAFDEAIAKHKARRGPR